MGAWPRSMLHCRPASWRVTGGGGRGTGDGGLWVGRWRWGRAGGGLVSRASAGASPRPGSRAGRGAGGGLGLHSTRLASRQVARRGLLAYASAGPPLVLDQGRPPLARAAKAVRGAPVPPLPPGSKHPTLPHGMGRGQSPTPVVTLQTGVRTGVLTLRQDTRPDAGNGTRIFGFSPWMWRYGRGQPTRCLRPMPPLKRSAAAKSVTQSLRLSYPAPARRSRLHSDPARRGGRGGAPVRPPRAPSAGPGPTPAAAAASVAAPDE